PALQPAQALAPPPGVQPQPAAQLQGGRPWLVAHECGGGSLRLFLILDLRGWVVLISYAGCGWHRLIIIASIQASVYARTCLSCLALHHLYSEQPGPLPGSYLKVTGRDPVPES